MAAGCGADGVGHGAVGQVVALQPAVQDHLGGAGHAAVMAADHRLGCAHADERLALGRGVPAAQTGGAVDRQILGRARGLEAAAQGAAELLGIVQAQEVVENDAISVLDALDGVIRG